MTYTKKGEFFSFTYSAWYKYTQWLVKINLFVFMH